ncbi:NACHT domain-containing protein [Actinacidiphila oryziradicis]|uniref:NACHT domain-containing protein n=1 Tax=Actinacidiphila oryziradicis TaxID=2571141 RepID=UPI001B80B679|nr:NACHT domain-containing protein [Actinacidiphila oryziradicis]
MGVRYLLLVVLGTIVALALSRYFHLGTAQTAVAVVLSLAPAYITWAAFRADRAEATAIDLDTAAGQLAVAVKAQWDDEAAVRRVNDPYPLPVAWRATDDDLAESWPLLTDLARAWPGGPPGDPALWPHHPAGLAGADAQIGEVFTDRVPTRRLVVLGEPGAGKSVLLIRLLQDLIERRTDSSPVPVLFSLASWNPRQPLKTWLAEQLRRTHPGLRTPAPTPVTTTAGAPGDLAQALLDAGRILPLLDGLDELPPAWHATALDALNRALPAKQPLVLASRAAPYRAALTCSDTTVRLNGAAAIQLLPLTPEAAADYLRRDAGGPHAPAADRWDTVATSLGTATPVGQALGTPLGLFLARTIYNPRPNTEPGPAAPHPDELCDTTAFPDRTTVDTYLFRAFIPAAYTPHNPYPPRWTAEQAHRTFVFLAQFLQNQRGGSPDLAWWELPQALPARTRRLTAAIPAGIAGGLAFGVAGGFGGGLAVGLAGGLAGGLAVAIAFGRTLGRRVGSATPSTRLRWSPSGLAVGLGGGITLGIALGIAGQLAGGLGGGLAGGLAVGPAVGIALGIALGLETEEPDLTSITGPVTQFSLDRRAFIAFGLAVGIAFGVGVGVGVGVTFGDSYGVGVGVTNGLGVGIAFGIAFGTAGGLSQTAWAYFVMARTYLVVRRKVPRDLMAFLRDAHEHRSVLRQVGAVYQFRHIDLQRHLAQHQT